jgi:hypothetical protein
MDGAAWPRTPELSDGPGMETKTRRQGDYRMESELSERLLIGGRCPDEWNRAAEQA